MSRKLFFEIFVSIGKYNLSGMNRYLLLFFSFFIVGGVFGQIGHGGSPLMQAGSELKSQRLLSSSQSNDVVTFEPPDAALVAAEIRNNRKGRPLHFAHPNFVELTPANSGNTVVLDDGRLLWQLRLRSPGAHSLNIIFDKFHLSPGDSLFIYNRLGSHIIGALTHENNKSWGTLATAPVPGDEVVVEWRGSTLEDGETRLQIGAVNHDFVNIFKVLSGGDAGVFGSSGSCNSDFSCFENDIYQKNGKATCQVIFDGTTYCSGTLMNNSNNDGTPYVLTAGHCMGANLSPESIIFVFNYESPACRPEIQGSPNQSISGSQLRAFADQLDFALLEMSVYPPDYFRPYYAGWNLSEDHLPGLHSIHHPNGDVKKIALSENAPVKGSYLAKSLFDNQFEPDSHWKVAEWAEGTTEGGSSGAGLFLDEGAFIGHLSGGSAICGNPVNDYFIRLEKIWDFLTPDSARVDVWLNPSGDSRTSLAGYSPENGNLQRLSHFPQNGTPFLSTQNLTEGTWSGANNQGVLSVAERYDEISSAKIYGLFLIPGRNKIWGDGKIDVRIWSGLDTPSYIEGGKTGVIINDTVNKEMLVLFDEPLLVSGPVFGGYEISYDAPVDSFSVYQADLSEGENSFFVKHPSEGWQSYQSLSGGVPSMIWIDVLVGDVIFTDSISDKSPSENLVLAPNPASNYFDLFFGDNGEGVVTIYDLTGKTRLKEHVVVFNNRSRISIEGKLASGTYLLQLEIDNRKVIEKLMVR
jgi:lysyl endopeptidase